jgi:plastocyanin
LLASFLPALRWQQQTVVNPAVAGALAGIVVIVGIAAPIIWARNPTTTASSPDTTYASASTSGGTGGDTAPATTVAAGSTVSIKGFAFNPAQISVKVGDTVTWTNNDDTTHTVTASDGSFDSGNLDTGKTFSQTFTTAGTFSYICSIHTGMKATVTVTG